MCEPATVLGVLAVAGSAVSAVGQYQQASASNKAAGEQAQAQADEYANTRDQQIGERIKESRRERARLRVSAGESGVAGASFEAALRQSFGDQNQDIAIAQKQGKLTSRSLKAQTKASTKSFSPVASGLQIASAGYSAYNSARPAPKATTKKP